MLTKTRIHELANGTKVRSLAVTNFLGSLEGNTQDHARTNLDQDARSYRWNAATVEAIRIGILEYFTAI